MFPQTLSAKGNRAFELRRLEVTDAANCLAYIHEVSGQTDFLSFGVGEYSRTVEEQASRIERFSKSETDLHLVAMLEDRIAGMIDFGVGKRPRTRHAGDFGMSVHKDFWGIGIGSALLGQMLSWLRSNGTVKKVNLRVRADNFPAIRLYERYGFSTEGTVTRDYIIDGQFFDSLIMGLEID